jgi:hypothetical protein
MATRKLYSVPVLLVGTKFVGSFEDRGKSYSFSFVPASLEVSGASLQLKGHVALVPPGGRERSADGVRATLAAAQGGIFGTPRRPPGEQMINGMPVTEATGATGFAGVLYLRLSPLDGKALGVPLDLTTVQMNARIYPISDLERELQVRYSDLVSAVKSEQVDVNAATEQATAINKLLQST